MREIKLRAWHNGKSKIFRLEDIANWGPSWDGPEFSEYKDWEQYTGLKDKNGKEIYEGDIVVQPEYIWFDDGKPNYRGTVEWVYAGWQVIAHCVNKNKAGISEGANEILDECGWGENQNSEWAVIGNIHENPELINA